MTKQYKFKIFFNEIACYREISVNADTDEQARNQYAKEFHKDPYLYPFADDMKNLPKKIYRVTYEIKEETKGGLSTESSNSRQEYRGRVEQGTKT